MMTRIVNEVAIQWWWEVAESANKENLNFVWSETISNHYINIDSYL